MQRLNADWGKAESSQAVVQLLGLCPGMVENSLQICLIFQIKQAIYLWGELHFQLLQLLCYEVQLNQQFFTVLHFQSHKSLQTFQYLADFLLTELSAMQK